MLTRAFVFGVDHHHAPLQVREVLAHLDQAQLAAHLKQAGADESLVLSTCNRFEVYGLADCHGLVPLAFGDALASQGLNPDTIYPHAYHKVAGSMVRHGFGVAAALESMVVGETQILGQMKQTWHDAQESGRIGGFLSRFGQAAFHAGKRVRTETGIGRLRVSVASTAVELAQNIHGDLSRTQVMLIGAGDMATSAAEHLKKAGVGGITVCNRSDARATQLAAQFGAQVTDWADLPQALVTADVVITSTASKMPVLTLPLLTRVAAQRRGRPLFVVDLAVPRDSDPAIHTLDDVYLYDMDQLSHVAARALARRHSFVHEAEKIVDEEVEKFLTWADGRYQVDLVRALRTHFETTRQQVLARGDLNAEEATRLLINKLLHHPLATLKTQGDDDHVAEAAATLFALNRAQETLH